MKDFVTRVALALVFVPGMQQSAIAQTCSCAGIPVLTTIDTSATQAGEFFINYTSEYHKTNDLVSGSKEVSDITGRDRSSLSYVVSASYALTDRWAVSTLISYVEHTRDIAGSFFGETTSSDLGDSVILARYTPLFITPFSRDELSLGLGLRIPTGENDAKNNGIVLSEDMQPGLGATGKLAWASYTHAFNQAATLQFNATASYIDNEENDRDYAFGNELNVSLGVSQSIGTKFSYAAMVRYRKAKNDSRLGFTIFNSGGKWLDFVPSVQYFVSDNLAVGLSGRVPISRDLNGTLQFTTSYSYALSLTYGF